MSNTMNHYAFDQRVHLRRDPEQFGRIGCGGYGDVYDARERVQLVFWEHEGCDVVSAEKIDDLMSEEEHASIQVMERLYDAVQASLDAEEAPLHVGGRVLICMGEESGKLGTVYNYQPSRPAPWHVRPDGWSSNEPGIAYMAEELQPINAKAQEAVK